MADNTEAMIKKMLDDPNTISKINGILSSLDGSGSEASEKPPELPPGLQNPEMLMKIGKIMQQYNGMDDDGVNLIRALKPFLSGKRAKSAEQAIKILKLSRMTTLFQDIDL